jgi:hypothetical protein
MQMLRVSYLDTQLTVFKLLAVSRGKLVSNTGVAPNNAYEVTHK